MEILLIIVSIVLIALVLLQSNKASEAGQIITGGNSMLHMQLVSYSLYFQWLWDYNFLEIRNFFFLLEFNTYILYKE